MHSSLRQSVLAASFIAVSFVTFSIVVSADNVSTSVTVGNAAPAISATSLNGSAAITLTENTTKKVYATTTVTDANGCSTIYQVVANLRRSGIAAASCDVNGEDNENNCHAVLVGTVEAGSCTGAGDTAANYVFSTDMQFFADPTDSGTFAAENWTIDIVAGDGVATTTSAASASVELNSLTALNVNASLNYGTVAASADTGATNSTTTVTNTGNVAMDPDLSGTVMSSGGNTIPVGSQEYSSSPFVYGAGTDLTTSGVRLDLTLPKPTAVTPVTDDVSWGIGIPAGTVPGSYTGTNTFTAVAI